MVIFLIWSIKVWFLLQLLLGEISVLSITMPAALLLLKLILTTTLWHDEKCPLHFCRYNPDWIGDTSTDFFNHAPPWIRSCSLNKQAVGAVSCLTSNAKNEPFKFISVGKFLKMFVPYTIVYSLFSSLICLLVVVCLHCLILKRVLTESIVFPDKYNPIIVFF
jgi:hypothetical protein